MLWGWVVRYLLGYSYRSLGWFWSWFDWKHDDFLCDFWLEVAKDQSTAPWTRNNKKQSIQPPQRQQQQEAEEFNPLSIICHPSLPLLHSILKNHQSSCPPNQPLVRIHHSPSFPCRLTCWRLVSRVSRITTWKSPCLFVRVSPMTTSTSSCWPPVSPTTTVVSRWTIGVGAKKMLLRRPCAQTGCIVCVSGSGRVAMSACTRTLTFTSRWNLVSTTIFHCCWIRMDSRRTRAVEWQCLSCAVCTEWEKSGMLVPASLLVKTVGVPFFSSRLFVVWLFFSGTQWLLATIAGDVMAAVLFVRLLRLLMNTQADHWRGPSRNCSWPIISHIDFRFFSHATQHCVVKEQEKRLSSFLLTTPPPPFPIDRKSVGEAKMRSNTNKVQLLPFTLLSMWGVAKQRKEHWCLRPRYLKRQPYRAETTNETRSISVCLRGNDMWCHTCYTRNGTTHANNVENDCALFACEEKKKIDDQRHRRDFKINNSF